MNGSDSGMSADLGDGSSNDGATDRAPDSIIATGSGGNGGQISGTGGVGTGGMGVGGYGGQITGTGGVGTGGMGVGGYGGQITGTGGMGVGGNPGGGIGGAGTGGRTGVGGMAGVGGRTGVGGTPGIGGMIGVGGRTGIGGMTGVGGTPGIGGTPGVGGATGTGGSGSPNGDACTSGTQCQSGICIDGVCCNRACDGQCEACDIDRGRCTVVQSGPVHGTRLACPAGTNPACGSQCAGMPMRCGDFPQGTNCTCLVPLPGVSTCNGAGSCAVSLLGGLTLCDGL
ncbi:MAG TPA: hypothetical protein VFH68_16880 [Polyangia bacterium]|nr:hypothetical protein [Polyangia bacterium]